MLYALFIVGYVIPAIVVLFDTYLWFKVANHPTLGTLLARVFSAFFPMLNLSIALVSIYERLDKIPLKNVN